MFQEEKVLGTLNLQPATFNFQHPKLRYTSKQLLKSGGVIVVKPRR
jgi:hypothetical protein